MSPDHFEVEDTDFPDHDTYTDRRVAAAVLHRAALDFITDAPKPYKGQPAWELDYKLRMWQASRADAYKFLVGQSEMSAFWFKVLERPYQTGSFEELRAEMKRRLS